MYRLLLYLYVHQLKFAVCRYFMFYEGWAPPRTPFTLLRVLYEVCDALCPPVIVMLALPMPLSLIMTLLMIGGFEVGHASRSSKPSYPE